MKPRDEVEAANWKMKIAETCKETRLKLSTWCVRELQSRGIHAQRRPMICKGALTGGYHDVRRSRIEAIRNINGAERQVRAEDSEGEGDGG
ncbi:hypothetical protein M378DRAFT_163991, partial [Amanita muscaria Koide BX008]